jgi:hypothetical protein
MPIHFQPPTVSASSTDHHKKAAKGNAKVTAEASGVLQARLDGTAPVDRILLRAAAGAGKSYALKSLVADAIAHANCKRVAVVAFTNKQTHPLAAGLGAALGKERVCLFTAESRLSEVPPDTAKKATVITGLGDIPDSIEVVVATCHKLGGFSGIRKLLDHFGAAANGSHPFDVLFVDEAWQVPHFLFAKVKGAAPIHVGVGDVGQLPPLEVGENPWRGDPGHNPYRAWPTDFDDDPRTWAREMPAVWRPAAGQLALWRAFYPEWGTLNCVAGPNDRSFSAKNLADVAADIWNQVGTGVPTLIEVDGLADPEAPDVDLPLIEFVESLLDELFAAGFTLTEAQYGADGNPTGKSSKLKPKGKVDDPLIALLATRNQAVDDLSDVVERLTERYDLSATDLLASTVDSYQGQTNGITVALHPLTGASQLDEFNSAFGRLAVTCTRAKHGLLLVARTGLDQLLAEAPARPGTPFGEPGNRQLPRQTHQRILDTFARAKIDVAP